MKYVDLHCDTLTVCSDRGLNLADCGLQTDLEKLNRSQCAAQCFAIFTEGGSAALNFEKYLSFYKQSLPKLQHIAAPIYKFDDILTCEKNKKTGIILTVENLGFIGDDLKKIDYLAGEGVKMASLVWNYENTLASPNLIFEGGMPQFHKRNSKGLTPLGKEVIERFDYNKIIIDISHLSDGGTDEILAGRKTPIVASHSNAQSVFDVSRNLTDVQIKKIADCGGAIGVNFCMDFLGEGSLSGLLRHIKHIMNIGGEDVVAFGSDFDGIPENPHVTDCTAMPQVFEYLLKNGLSYNTLEKIAYKNFYRVFKEVCG